VEVDLRRWVAALSLLLLPSCGAKLPRFDVTLQIIDEDGRAVPGAQLELRQETRESDANGELTLRGLEGPVMGVVRADGYLPEPLPIGWGDAGQTVRLRILHDGGGSRWTMHFAGDSMIGRRYQQPPSGDPLVPVDDLEAGALDVVQHVVLPFAAADFRSINVETTVSHLPPAAAYPGKRFILNTPPETLVALQALEVDSVILANNHVNDYQEEGLIETLDALDAYGLKYTGAAVDEAGATRPVIHQVGDVEIGTLAWTSVTGSFVNDQYPDGSVPIPDGTPVEELWQYEPRLWSFEDIGLSVPSAERRIGEAWRIYADAESDLTPEVKARAWASMVEVYPEMQDWVARRGHGGAAMWLDATSPDAIATLKEEVDLVVVQLHSGFQYMWAPSASVRDNAYRAIDAGADIVICHHPHVLQGFEWYRGRLIAYSLGNFIFDQDFLATFASAYLRTVWDGTELVEARVVPVEIQGYRPTPVTDGGARRNLLNLWELSVRQFESLRDPATLGVRAVRMNPYPDTQPAHFVLEHHTARIVDQRPEPELRSMTLEPWTTRALDNPGLVDARLGLVDGTWAPGLMIGKDTFGWGRFEDEVADQLAEGSTHWVVSGLRKRVVDGDEAAAGERFLQLTRYATEGELLIRPAARVVLPLHREYTDAAGSFEPLDPDPSYTLRFAARLTGGGQPGVRLDIYEFDDSNPTEDPSSVLLNRIERSVSVEAGAGWQVVEVEISNDDLTFGGLRGNMATFYVTFGPPSSGMSTLDVDELAFIEWRPAAENPSHWGAYGFVRNHSEDRRELEFEVLP
jgi:poly-gamma-glutamate capsule biosynthesis protein CapA/YwtB (metallophosphatase superfamily)